VVLFVLEGEDDPSVINSTCIVLIPKVEKPVELGQYRPISLCNVIYKIASKTVANRLDYFARCDIGRTVNICARETHYGQDTYGV